MNVVWKRPDGFHGASPTDFQVVEVGDHSRIWLHKVDHENFPFRVSGGWEDEAASRRLNRLVNQLTQSKDVWIETLREDFFNSKTEDAQDFLRDLHSWLENIRPSLKGDTWELAIMNDTLNEVNRRLQVLKDEFLSGV